MYDTCTPTFDVPPLRLTAVTKKDQSVTAKTGYARLRFEGQEDKDWTASHDMFFQREKVTVPNKSLEACYCLTRR
ncbi:hypothetical protein MPTK1_2g18590 [Marchantia polymorpha subsp. ruderalis]|uniref:Uncharacterized protein n=1 Tax=Marchantia polymorpha TaxID=3197 RepID=A0A2R6W728_MARPO|nr:hypothetical protein MARPO_0137s0022 [Marchantia polymorpha]BBN02841.1 hypothetical protein Mp_2g18590 [Marchantia polymorpha subsp. ruderalis]|eukprot:PTQ29654.1 hypothetical protein MARPO_0137s0022 [Marchantia polymorpha]